MTFKVATNRRAALAALLATSLGAPAVTLTFDAPDPDAPRHNDVPSAPSDREPSGMPAPGIIVRPPQDPRAPARERELSSNPHWDIPLSNLSTTRDRPIFSPSRRPPPPAVAAAPPAQATPPPTSPRIERPQLSLIGTVGGDEESIGIFVDETTKAALRLKIGGDYQGWELRSVQGRDVTLQRDQKTTILSLPQPGGGLGPASGQVENVASQRPAGLPPQRDPRH